jgi:tRNA (guanine-N7-)-methyltransferase
VSRQKTYKYEWAERLANVIQAPKPFWNTCQGKWNSDYFENANRLVVELGCGRGEYTNGLAKLFPNMNFIGVDVKGDRLAAGGREADALGLSNVGFLRICRMKSMKFGLPFRILE